MVKQNTLIYLCYREMEKKRNHYKYAFPQMSVGRMRRLKNPCYLVRQKVTLPVRVAVRELTIIRSKSFKNAR